MEATRSNRVGCANLAWLAVKSILQKEALEGSDECLRFFEVDYVARIDLPDKGVSVQT